MNGPAFDKLQAEMRDLMKRTIAFPPAKEMREKALKFLWGDTLDILGNIHERVVAAADRGEFSINLTLAGIKSVKSVNDTVELLKGLGYSVISSIEPRELTGGDEVNGTEAMFSISWHRE